eukprot:jgi/Tetstr1/443754/TSEL_031742.t1
MGMGVQILTDTDKPRADALKITPRHQRTTLTANAGSRSDAGEEVAALQPLLLDAHKVLRGVVLRGRNYDCIQLDLTLEEVSQLLRALSAGRPLATGAQSSLLRQHVAQIERMAGYLQQHLEHACRRLPSRQAANSTATLDASFAVVKRQSRELAKEVQLADARLHERISAILARAGGHNMAALSPLLPTLPQLSHEGGAIAGIQSPTIGMPPPKHDPTTLPPRSRIKGWRPTVGRCLAWLPGLLLAGVVSKFLQRTEVGHRVLLPE